MHTLQWNNKSIQILWPAHMWVSQRCLSSEQEEETKDIWGILHGAASLFSTFVNHEFGGRLVANCSCSRYQDLYFLNVSKSKSLLVFGRPSTAQVVWSAKCIEVTAKMPLRTLFFGIQTSGNPLRCRFAWPELILYIQCNFLFVNWALICFFRKQEI